MSVIRPFYIRASIDGRNTALEGGPKAKTGGQQIILKQRKNGESVTAFSILSYPENRDGKLHLITKVFDRDNKKVAEYETEY